MVKQAKYKTNQKVWTARRDKPYIVLAGYFLEGHTWYQLKGQEQYLTREDALTRYEEEETK